MLFIGAVMQLPLLGFPTSSAQSSVPLPLPPFAPMTPFGFGPQFGDMIPNRGDMTPN